MRCQKVCLVTLFDDANVAAKFDNTKFSYFFLKSFRNTDALS